ncbi:MAG: tRNA-binding protein [Flavobacteriales bacterium]|nr:tRNA-binding protein [Flavobacteriales bacterium]
MEGSPPALTHPIDFAHFAACDLRVGQVLSVENLESARRPAFVLHLDFGPLGQMKSTAQLKEDHTAEDLIGRQVVAVVNLPPKQVGNHTSRCLVLGAVHGPHVGLLSVPSSVPNGTRIH